MDKKLLILCGPTATGKTALGIRLAKKFNGEIVSADSRQVYRGMDIGTGKDLPLNTKYKILNTRYKGYRLGYYLFDKVPVWLLDIVAPDYQFNVADYASCANAVINDIWAKGKLPILVGGTGFYIKGLVEGIESLGVEPDLKLREKLRNLEIEKLREKLKDLDPRKWEQMNKSDRRNPRRLVRAIEIAKKYQASSLGKLGMMLSEAETSNIKYQTDRLKIKDVLMIGLTAPNKILYERIDQRVDERVKQGIIEEIKKLLKKGYRWENSALSKTIGYQEWGPYFENSQLEKAIIQKWKYDEHHYARRQITWFRKSLRENQGIWFDISQKGWENEVEKLAENWYNENKDAEN